MIERTSIFCYNFERDKRKKIYFAEAVCRSKENAILEKMGGMEHGIRKRTDQSGKSKRNG